MGGSWKGLFVFSTVFFLIHAGADYLIHAGADYLIHVVAIQLKETWSFLLARFNLKIWIWLAVNQCYAPYQTFWENQLLSTKQINNSALAIKWEIGSWSANAILSYGPGNEETSRKWGNPSGSPRIILGAIFDANCEMQGSATVFSRKLNLRRRWTVCSLAWEAVLKILNHGKRVNYKISVAETL